MTKNGEKISFRKYNASESQLLTINSFKEKIYLLLKKRKRKKETEKY